MRLGRKFLSFSELIDRLSLPPIVLLDHLDFSPGIHFRKSTVHSGTIMSNSLMFRWYSSSLCLSSVVVSCCCWSSSSFRWFERFTESPRCYRDGCLLLDISLFDVGDFTRFQSWFGGLCSAINFSRWTICVLGSRSNKTFFGLKLINVAFPSLFLNITDSDLSSTLLSGFRTVLRLLLGFSFNSNLERMTLRCL